MYKNCQKLIGFGTRNFIPGTTTVCESLKKIRFRSRSKCHPIPHPIDRTCCYINSSHQTTTKERTLWKIKFAPHQSQGKKEQCQKERERRRTDRRKKSSIKEFRRMGRSSEHRSGLMAPCKDLARLTHPRRLLKRTIMLPSKQDVQYPN